MNKYSYELRPFTANKPKTREIPRLSSVNNFYTTPRSQMESVMNTHRSGFGNESMQKNMVSSISENNLTMSLISHQFIPQETAKYFDMPSPDDSRYDLNLEFPKRPSTSKLSSLTHRENERMRYKSHFIIQESSSIQTPETASNLLLNSPSDIDFRRIITQLDRVASQNHFMNKKLILKEGKQFESNLQESENQYLRVLVKDKKCPLTVEIKRKHGQLRVFVSKTVAEPNEDMCDFKFAKDVFHISDMSSKFRCEYLFFCIHSVRDCGFSMVIQLGKSDIRSSGNLISMNKPEFNLESIKRDEALRLQFKKEIETLHKNMKNKSMMGSKHKNFIKINTKMSPSFSFKKEKSPDKTWEIRKNEVQTRKSIVIEQKKVKIQLYINRREIRLEREKQQKGQEIENELREKFYKCWVVFIYHSKALTCIKQHIQLGRIQIFQKFRISSSARRIQKLYRLSVKGLNTRHLALIHCRNNLNLYRHTTKPHILQTSRIHIFLTIKQTAINNTLANHFDKFRSQSNLYYSPSSPATNS